MQALSGDLTKSFPDTDALESVTIKHGIGNTTVQKGSKHKPVFTRVKGVGVAL